MSKAKKWRCTMETSGAQGVTVVRDSKDAALGAAHRKWLEEDLTGKPFRTRIMEEKPPERERRR